jgi:hypothetical protein
LRGFRVLDPACGSGNFLYLALHALKDAEQRVLIECEAFGLGGAVSTFGVGPQQLLGLEINEFAAELAGCPSGSARYSGCAPRLQRARQPGVAPAHDDILPRRPGRPDGSEAEWPEADVIIGNPPWLGGKLLRRNLGDAPVEGMFHAYRGRVAAEADLACYWVEKAAERVSSGKRSGRGWSSPTRSGRRQPTDPGRAIGRGLRIFDAWDDEPWEQDGAAVRASLLCLAGRRPGGRRGAPRRRACRGGVRRPHRAPGRGGRRGRPHAGGTVAENLGVAFMGDTKGGAFDMPGRDGPGSGSRAPLNPNGRPNSDVLRPWANGST